MKKKQTRVLLTSAVLIIIISLFVIWLNSRHPNGFLDGIFRPSYHSSASATDAQFYMNNFNALSETDEALQWQLDVRSIQLANADRCGVYAYEGYDAVSAERMLVLWPADKSYEWNPAAGITAYVAKVRNRCPQFCDFSRLSRPGSVPRSYPPVAATAAAVERDLGIAKGYISGFKPIGNFGVWGVFLSDWLISRLPSLAPLNGTICVSMAALKSDGKRLRAIISQTDGNGLIQFGPCYISDWDQIMATSISTPFDRPK